MTTHEVSIDLMVDPDTGDHAYKAFCETCPWSDPDGWHHSETDDEDAVAEAWAEAHGAGHHHAEAADDSEPAPDIRLFQALPIPTTDQGGYALPDAAI